MCVYVFPLSLYTRPIRDSIFRLVRCCCCARRPSVRARLQCLGITSTLFRFIFFSSKVSIWLAKSKLLANNSTSWSATPWLYWSSILVVALRQHQNASYLVYEGITQGNVFFIFAPVPLTSTHGPMPSPRLACPLDLRCSMRPATTRGNSLFFPPQLSSWWWSTRFSITWFSYISSTCNKMHSRKLGNVYLCRHVRLPQVHEELERWEP